MDVVFIVTVVANSVVAAGSSYTLKEMIDLHLELVSFTSSLVR